MEPTQIAKGKRQKRIALSPLFWISKICQNPVEMVNKGRGALVNFIGLILFETQASFIEKEKIINFGIAGCINIL